MNEGNSMPFSRSEPDPGAIAAVDAYIEEQQADLVDFVQELVRFNTVSVDLSAGSDHRHNEEKPLQEVVADRLARLGAEIDQWEPDAAALRDHPMMPPWHHWEDRPMTVGVLQGAGEGRSLIINGHVDVVDPGDPERWSSPPFAAEIRDGRVYGRGAVDMKGGIAAALFAVEALIANGVRLRGDLTFESVTDEETCAMGTVAAIERGYRADAGLVPEPTNMNLWIATRGLLHGTLRIPGRSAHAEVNQPDWQEGGGVNAIEHSLPLMRALEELNADWERRPAKAHQLLGRPRAQPTVIRGGGFISNMPESCEIQYNATYLPGDADKRGYGSTPRGEIVEAVARAASDDDWLEVHPPEWSWATDYPPSEIPEDEEIIAAASAAARSLGTGGNSEGIDTTYDGALLTRLGGVPSPAFGPGDLGRAHALDEWIGIDELVLGARVYARVICQWCGIHNGKGGVR